MATPKQELLKALMELTDKELKEFKWFLKDSDGAGSPIPAARLEGTDRMDTVDLMVQKYYGDGALEIAAKILQKVNRKDLSHRLQTRVSGLQNLESQTNKVNLKDTKAKIQQMIEERRKKIWEIKKSAETSRKSAEQQIRNSERVFAVLHQSVDESLRKLTAEIEKKQKSTQEEADKLIQELERQLLILTRSAKNETPPFKDHRDVIAQLSGENWTEVSVSQPSYGGTVVNTVNQMKRKLIQQIESLVVKTKLTRAQQFAVDVTLDPDTAHPNLILSDDEKQVYSSNMVQDLPEHPGRFDVAVNVLARQRFSSGRFYYEVQVEGKTSWDLGVVHESVNRKGSIKAKPDNGFWTIGLSTGGKYNASTGHVRVNTPLKKVGVFVDYDNKSVCFFDVDSADIFHTFKDCSFKGKLLPFFCPGTHRDGQNARPLIICPVSHKD